MWIVGDRDRTDKIAAIGIRVAEGVTMHGFALNCSNGFEAYDQSSPAASATPGSPRISEVLGRTVTPSDVVPLVKDAFTRVFGNAELETVA